MNTIELSLAPDIRGMLRKMNDERQPAREQPHRRSRIKYARLPLYGYNIGAGVTWEGGRRGMAAAAMVGGMSLVSNCVVCDIFFEGARAQIQNGVQSIAIFSIDRPSSVKYGTLCNHELLQHHDASSRRRHMPCISMQSHASYDLLFGRFEASDDDALGRFEVEAVMW